MFSKLSIRQKPDDVPRLWGGPVAAQSDGFAEKHPVLERIVFLAPLRWARDDDGVRWYCPSVLFAGVPVVAAYRDDHRLQLGLPGGGWLSFGPEVNPLAVALDALAVELPIEDEASPDPFRWEEGMRAYSISKPYQ